MMWIVFFIIFLAIIYLAWDIWRVVRLNWKSAAKLGETIGKSVDRMGSVEAPSRPEKQDESPVEVRVRIAQERAYRKARRLTGTIGRWQSIKHD